MTQTTVDDIMSRNLTTIGRNDTLDVADAAMNLKGIRHLPVVSQGEVVGVISQRDLLRASLARVLGYGERGREKMLQTIAVKEVMTEPAITVAPDTTIQEAARTLTEKKIGCLPVVAGKNLVGIVTVPDMLRHAWDSERPRPTAHVAAHFR
jgi:CBS domain-containing protein